MQDEHNIISALQKGVIAAIAQSSTPTLPVKYLLTDSDATNDGGFVVPADQKWLELVWIPNNRTGDFLGGEMNYQGILRLVLHWPNKPTGVYAPLDLLGSISRFFTIGKSLSGVQVYAIPRFDGTVENGSENLLTVSIFYRSYRKGT